MKKIFIIISMIVIGICGVTGCQNYKIEQINATVLSSNEESDVTVASVDDVLENKDLTVIGNADYEYEQLEEKLGDISVTQAIVANEKALMLYPIFEQQDEAIDNIKEDCAKILNQLQEYYGLEEFSKDSLMEYESVYSALLDEDDCPDWYTETSETYCELDMFFDIYKDEQLNEELIEMAMNATSAEELLENEDFLMELPSDTLVGVQ
ncbi:hypothetical protein [Eubacterium oxidoreducens]|uniref:Uncharacterized protein n=1 Tax=Eubacterium oxidoreducens TaxID=1732 RepID=A0A1G6BNR0_EUBOX|nr:hypothetical protein [Eubacterium oxidoreducens]SDB22198.1 hypothetical protein SAMN02910417_01670 [Eubacterium oxidoreducens]